MSGELRGQQGVPGGRSTLDQATEGTTKRSAGRALCVSWLTIYSQIKSRATSKGPALDLALGWWVGLTRFACWVAAGTAYFVHRTSGHLDVGKAGDF